MYVEHVFEELQARARGPVTNCDRLDESTLWSPTPGLIWECGKPELFPSFYPAYRHGNLYSWSLLALVLRKGRLSVNGTTLARAASPGFEYLGGNGTLDLDVERVGGPHRSRPSIRDPEDYARQLAEALIADTSAVEARSRAAVNVVLCGGKDSLNLLLLPWKHPVVALSAYPNFPLVQRFVAENDLGIEVLQLEDPADPKVQEEEVLFALARADLSHWRWGVHLKRVAHEIGPGAVFWKGQLADVYTTAKWKDYTDPPTGLAVYPRKLYKRMDALLPCTAREYLGNRIQSSVVEAAWTRGAALQGIHMEFLRHLTGRLFLSGYHGPAVTRVWEQVVLPAAAAADMRDRIGRHLAGRSVRYPACNPAPPVSIFRRDWGHPHRLLALLDRLAFPYSYETTEIHSGRRSTAG